MFRCDVCNFITLNKKDYTRHLQTVKHLKKSNTNQHNDIVDPVNFVVNNVQFHKCEACNAIYKYKSGLSRHLRSCVKYNQFSKEHNIILSNETMDVFNNLKQIMMEFVKSNNDVVKSNNDVVKSNCELTKNTTELMKTNQEVIAHQHATNDKLVELCINNSAASVTNNNIYNHKGDNHFSINVFLNEKCKDAMNITDFVNSIELSREDMENVGKNGYVKGISNIFIDNLKNTDIHKRPIHCSDRKREVLYVKEHDKWEREGVNSDNLINAVKKVEHKNLVILNEWAKQNPECENSYTRANDTYMKFSKNVQDGEDENIIKVIKHIAKETVIERNSLVE
jgi:uncharacterized C2H2 Zn-finger protein